MLHVVCVKQVPDTHNITGDVMTKDGTMNRGALPAIFNPEDLNALEMALQVRDRHGGTVTVATAAARVMLVPSSKRGKRRRNQRPGTAGSIAVTGAW